MATTEVGIDNIQHQIDNCDDIVTKIDDIVPLLYKVRQQALAQKNYVNDILKKLLTDAFTSMDVDRIITIGNSQLSGEGLVEDSKAVNTFSIINSADQRAVIQSLFKFKHDCGTSTHFTTEQIGNANDRTKGLNLDDAITILSGIKAILDTSNESSNASPGDITKTIITRKDPSIGEITPENTIQIVSDVAVSANSYKSDNINGIESLFQEIDLLGVNTGFIGFGLGS